MAYELKAGVIFENPQYIIIKKDFEQEGSLFSGFDVLDIALQGVEETIDYSPSMVVSILNKATKRVEKIIKKAIKAGGINDKKISG